MTQPHQAPEVFYLEFSPDLAVSAAVKLIRTFLLRCAKTFGIPMRDQRTGLLLGRVLVIPVRGRLWIIGLSESVKPEFLTQARVTYWKQELGFSTYPEPDYPNVRS